MDKKIHLIKSKFSAVPADDDAQELFFKLKQGAIIAGESWTERAYWYHKKCFKLACVVTRNNPGAFKDPYNLIKALQFDVGSVNMVKRMTGEIVQIPKSIKFVNMKQNEFEKLFSDFVDVMMANLDILIPGMSKNQFHNIVLQIMELT